MCEGKYELFRAGTDRVLPIPVKKSDGQIKLASFLELLQDAPTIRLMLCKHCGNLQLFHFPDGHGYKAWAE